MKFKEKVYRACCDLLNEKILLLQQTMTGLKESAANESKSTAGDKHETALAMLQIEQKNAGIQMENLLSQKAVLDKSDPAVIPVHITNGALVTTSKGYLYISIPLGKIKVEGVPVIVLSAQSPLGVKLIRLQPGEAALVNGVEYVIERVE